MPEREKHFRKSADGGDAAVGVPDWLVSEVTRKI
jgi:hypothetical protein